MGGQHSLETLYRRLFDRLIPNGECLEWPGATADGYGKIVVKGKKVSVHRMAWTLERGDPGSLHVLHTCDNRRCANLDHLFLGTNADNVADKMTKGRHGNWGTVTNCCKHGHNFDEENTYMWHGERHCRKCRAARMVRWKAEHKCAN